MPDFTTIRMQNGTITVDMGDLFRRCYRATTDIKPLLKQVGMIMVASSQESFETQKRGDQVWPERGSSNQQVKNKALAVETANRGGRPPSRVFDARPALMSTNNSLLSSISARIENDKTVVVGTMMPYATKQQNGGEINIKLKREAVPILIEWSKANNVFKEMAPIIRRGKYVSQIKPRTFISIEKQDVEDVIKATRRYFMAKSGPPETPETGEAN